MSQEQAELMMLKGIISDCTADEQADIKLMSDKITALLMEKPAATILAISPVALKAQCDPKAYGLPG